MDTLIQATTTALASWLAPLDAYTLFENSGRDYALAVIVFTVATIGFAVIQYIVVGRLAAISKKTHTDIDDTLIKVVKGIHPPFYSFLAFYLAVQTLSFPEMVHTTLSVILAAWVAVQVVFALQTLIDYIIARRLRHEDDKGTSAAYRYLGNIAKWLLWIIAVLMVLANFGVNVTSVLAGLGVMGVAVGFALQKILADLFSSFAIYFDKPFQPGDFITAGADSGTVERIGIKTTRIRALQGEEIIISNDELTSARIQNFKRLNERRVAFQFGVLYETPLEKVQKIPDIVEETIVGLGEHVRFDRAHFAEFGDSALVFEVIYHVCERSYVAKMEAQHTINMQLMERFAKEGIEFAYPTQTVHVVK